MQKTIITCDVCKAEKNCETVRLNFNWHSNREKRFDICKECCIKANLFKEDTNLQYTNPPTTAEQLFALLEEIARNAVQE